MAHPGTYLFVNGHPVYVGDDDEDERTDITRLMDVFREEARMAQEAMEGATKATRKAVRAARRKGSVTNLRRVSQRSLATKPDGE